MHLPPRFQPRTLLRKYWPRLAVWAVCSTAAAFAVKTTALWYGTDSTEAPPADQPLVEKYDEVQGEWWNGQVKTDDLLAAFSGGSEQTAPVNSGENPIQSATPSSASSQFSLGTAAPLSTEFLQTGPALAPEEPSPPFEANADDAFAGGSLAGDTFAAASFEQDGDLPGDSSGSSLVAGPVPEPATGLLLAFGAVGLAALRRRAPRA